jgi:cellulose synthase/poly-beta-1,6-N-acetylglucosamine synthase-like glycosyltransferase
MVKALSQRLLPPEQLQGDVGFSVGICAADHATGIEELINIIERGPYPLGFTLKEIILVASGLDPIAHALIGTSANQHRNLILMEEPMRKGKSEAINRIIECFSGEFLVLINSDAHPEPGAITRIIDAIANDSRVGLVSASPVIRDRGGVTGAVLKLMWEVHNECLATLNEADLNNHCCDELIIIRSEALRKLPDDTVNDGAFMAGAAYRAGYSIKFCEEAKVRIDVPQRFSDLLKQRRRIVYGHLQILRSVGESPRTLESMIFNNPKLGLSILIRTLAKSPKFVLAFPVAVVGELVSVICGAIDSLTSMKKHVPWDRVGGRA